MDRITYMPLYEVASIHDIPSRTLTWKYSKLPEHLKFIDDPTEDDRKEILAWIESHICPCMRWLPFMIFPLEPSLGNIQSYLNISNLLTIQQRTIVKKFWHGSNHIYALV